MRNSSQEPVLVMSCQASRRRSTSPLSLEKLSWLALTAIQYNFAVLELLAYWAKRAVHKVTCGFVAGVSY